MSLFIAAALAAFFVKGLCQYAGVSKHSEFRGQQCFRFPRRAGARLPEQRHSDLTEPQKPRPKNLSAADGAGAHPVDCFSLRADFAESLSAIIMP